MGIRRIGGGGRIKLRWRRNVNINSKLIRKGKKKKLTWKNISNLSRIKNYPSNSKKTIDISHISKKKSPPRKPTDFLTTKEGKASWNTHTNSNNDLLLEWKIPKVTLKEMFILHLIQSNKNNKWKQNYNNTWII